MDYEYHYKTYLEVFARNRLTRDGVWDASGYCGRLLVTFLNSIFAQNYTSDSEKLVAIKAMNDAYRKTFPPDEA